MRMLLVLLMAGCGAGSRELECRRLPGFRPAGLLRPIIFYPRHRIDSPVPVIQIVVPADPGPVLVSLSTDGGLQRTMLTKRRSIRWPQGLRMLRPGEKGLVRVRAHSGSTRAGFVYAPVPADLPRLVNLRPDPRSYLDHGWPMEALRLRAATGAHRPHSWGSVILRSGFPRPLLW